MGNRVVDRVWKALSAVEGFAGGQDIFGADDDPAYFVNGTQVANMAEDAIGLRMTRRVISADRPRLRDDPRIELFKSGSDWVAVRPARMADADFVLELAETTAAVYRLPPGTPMKPPPTGADLARRRRFH